MKTSCFGSRVSCSFRNALRAAATSGRSCSAACRLFFKGQVDVVEEPRNPRLAHLHFSYGIVTLKKRTLNLVVECLAWKRFQRPPIPAQSTGLLGVSVAAW